MIPLGVVVRRRMGCPDPIGRLTSHHVLPRCHPAEIHRPCPPEEAAALPGLTRWGSSPVANSWGTLPLAPPFHLGSGDGGDIAGS